MPQEPLKSLCCLKSTSWWKNVKIIIRCTSTLLLYMKIVKTILFRCVTKCYPTFFTHSHAETTTINVFISIFIPSKRELWLSISCSISLLFLGIGLGHGHSLGLPGLFNELGVTVCIKAVATSALKSSNDISEPATRLKRIQELISEISTKW